MYRVATIVFASVFAGCAGPTSSPSSAVPEIAPSARLAAVYPSAALHTRAAVQPEAAAQPEAAPLPTADAQAEPAVTVDAQEADTGLVCKYEMRPGSRIAEEYCYTREERAATDEARTEQIRAWMNQVAREQEIRQDMERQRRSRGMGPF